MPPAYAFFCGMQSEAALIRRHFPQAPLAVAGPDPARAQAMAHHLLAQAPQHLPLSLGIAGGLDPTLHSGQLLQARALLTPAHMVLSAIRLPLFDIPAALFAGVTGPVAARADKAALHAQGAAAVDMETLPLALAAAAVGRPFAALRAVADPATQTIPPAALAGLDAAGHARPLAVAARLARRPQDLPALLTLALCARRAMAALDRGLAALARAP